MGVVDDKINPRSLRVFMAVHEEGSVTRAARRLLRVPSAVARTVQEIESALSVPLFERHSGGMLPTAYGQVVYQRARLIAAEFDAARRVCADMGANSAAPLLSMMVTARQLAAVARLRELGHMPSVAQALGMSQPAVSAALAHLEQALGLPLFRRTSRAMVVTDFGERLIFRLRRVLAELDRLQVDVSQLRGEVAGRVTLAALPSSKTWLLPRAISRLVARHPQIQVSVVDAPFEELFAAVQSGEIDFILTGISPEYRHRELQVQEIGRDHLVVVARAGHPLAAKRRIGARDLAHYPWVLRDPGAPSRQLLNGVFQQLGLQAPRIAVQAGDLGLVRGLLAQSDMLTAVSPQHFLHEIREGSLVVLDAQLPHSERDIGFVLAKDAQPSALCLLLMDEIRAMLGAVGPQEGW